jgi:hypothetical protein
LVTPPAKLASSLLAVVQLDRLTLLLPELLPAAEPTRPLLLLLSTAMPQAASTVPLPTL